MFVQIVSTWTEAIWQGWLEEHFEECCCNKNTDPGSKPRTEVFPSPDLSEERKETIKHSWHNHSWYKFNVYACWSKLDSSTRWSSSTAVGVATVTPAWPYAWSGRRALGVSKFWFSNVKMHQKSHVTTLYIEPLPAL